MDEGENTRVAKENDWHLSQVPQGTSLLVKYLKLLSVGGTLPV